MIPRPNSKLVIILLVAMLSVLTLSTFTASACEEPSHGDDNHDSGNVTGYFKDVPEDHWAFEAVIWMTQNDYLDGYGDNTFRPDNAVTRSEFAKMMVNVMKLDKATPSKPSFVDVSKGHWSYQYVETAKYYLTGFKTGSGDYFKPGYVAVREDMAVALVKALGYGSEAEDTSAFDSFRDQSKISGNLKRYVSLAIKYDIVKGYPTQDGGNEFRPMGQLTRAEAAVLLYRTMKQAEEKVTYDEDKVTYDEETENGYPVPAVSVTTVDGTVVVSWDRIDDSRLEGYKVVISKYNPSPKYSEDGYLYWITDTDCTQAAVDNSTAYKSGDFGQYLVPGTKYHFSVTAVYSGWVKIAGNAVQYTYTER